MPRKLRIAWSHPIFTLGHSVRPVEELLSLLARNGITLLADIRTVPKSRHNPQYWSSTLKKSLKHAGIGYIHLAGLGGLRKPRPDSRNTAWRNRSFQGYADYMQTEEFASALDELIELAGTERVAIMCAEAVPWRCHRNLVADALVVRGFQVEHIMSPTRNSVHAITPWARVRGQRITYPEQTEVEKTKPARKKAA